MSSDQRDGGVRRDAPLLTLRLLGGFRAERQGFGPVAERWRRPSARTVVKLLALAPGQRLHRDQVTEWCWPGADTGAARRSLRVCLHTARHTLEPELASRAASAYLATDGDLLCLVPGAVQVDVAVAEQAAVVALDAGDEPALTAVWAALDEELLPEDRYADWAAARRRELDALRRRVAVALAEARTAAGLPRAAVTVLERAVADAPTDEPLYRALIAACLAAGERAEAADHYRRLTRALHEELGAEPEAQTRELYSRAVRRRPAPTPPPVPPAAVRRSAGTPLRGRDSTLAALLAGLPSSGTRRAQESRSQASAIPLTVVSGESGVGKTRLVTEAARTAAATGTAVLWGAAHEAEGPLPYGPFADALAGWFADRPAAEREAAAAAHPDLGALLPQLAAPGPPQVRTAEEERARLYRAVGSLLAGLSTQWPLLVVLDDLHAADLGSLRLLHHLVRTVDGRPVRFLATLREEDLPEGDERRTVLAAAARQGLAHRVELMRLSRSDCDRLAADVAGGDGMRGDGAGALEADVLDTVYRLSRGNPLFAAELVRAVGEAPSRRGPHAEPLPGLGGGIPESVREVVALRAARLAPHVRQTLGVLAAAGGEAALAEAAEVAAAGQHPPVDGPRFAAALEDLVAARVVEECEVVHSGRRVPGLTFRHPVVGLAVYERLTVATRRQLHLAYAAAVRRHRPDAVDALAHHLDRADDPEAAVWLRRAAERAASLYADDSAVRYYGYLVARLDAAAEDAPGSTEAALARLAMAEVLIRQARHEQAEQVLRAALLALRTAGDRDGAVGAAALLAETLGRSGRASEGVALLREEYGSPDGGPPSGLGPQALTSHQLALAALWFQVGRYEEALVCAARAAEAASAGPVRAAEAASPGAARAVEAAPPGAVRAAEAASPGAAAGPRSDLRRASLSRALHIRAACLLLTGRPTAARASAEEALVIAEASGDLALQSRLCSILRELAERTGRVDRAARYAHQTIALAERTGDPAALAFERANLARIQLALGRPDEARKAARAAVDAARPLGATWCLPYCLLSLGEVELRAGRTEPAGTALREADRLARMAGESSQAIEAAQLLLAELELAQGRFAEALARVDGLRGAADAASHAGAGPAGSSAVHAVEAAALLALADAAGGERAARRAVAQARAERDRPAQTEARRVLGLALHSLGDRAAAERQWSAALRLARAMGHRAAEDRLLRAGAR
ncbi:AAA family ATPase [Streptomyces sp. NPDC051940]|uniref:ATP-binding protein n=1 Tax=Streptomyces sp. NPDC051940 TaxID=3155675 RepID=UPI00341376F0